MILERGILLNNRYRIVEILGQGGMGSVYRAVDENLGVEVAVKDNLFTTEEYAEQFRREATILANLRHPNLPRVTDHFVIEGQGQYLVMDYIEGEDLRQRMERMGVLPEEDVVSIGAAVCEALRYLGSRKPPIIHRDIKPGNVKITPQGHIYLVDFGLVKILTDSQATATGARAMTPGFSPPEQYGTARTDQRSDIYSLGATLFVALTGAIPEDALSRAMDQAELTPVRKHNPRVSQRLTSVIEKALEVRTADRYQTAEDFKQALLGTGAISQRKDGDYFVAPPPMEGVSVPTGGEFLTPLGAQDIADQAGGRSPQLLPISTPLEGLNLQPLPSSPRKGKKRGGCLVTLLLIVLLLVGAGGVIYMYDPGLPARTFAQYWPGAKLTAVTPTHVATALKGTPTHGTPSSAVGATPTGVTAITDVPSATATKKPTEIPTDIPTSIPTPQGGGNGQIAFVADRTGSNQIFIVNVDGTGLQKITDIPEGACQPDWSPDGTRLVFVSPCPGNTDYYPGSAMFIVNADGSGLLPLPTMLGGDFDPKWSPDGEHIAFTSLRNNGRPQIYLLDLEDETSIALSDKFSFDFQPAWSVDGEKIIFLSNRGGEQPIWMMDSDGENQERFSQNSNFFYTRPTWSPDMNTVLFTQTLDLGSVPRVGIVEYTFIPGDYIEYFVGQGSLPMQEAVYSPDGKWLAFEGWGKGESHDIYIISVTGIGRTAITDYPGLEFDPIWKPVP